MTYQTPYHEDQELDNNNSSNTHFRDILEKHISRRSLIKKTASGAAALALASSLSLIHILRAHERYAISYAVFCLKKKKQIHTPPIRNHEYIAHSDNSSHIF